MTEFIHDAGEAVVGVVAARKNIERKVGIETELVDIGEAKRDETEADAAFPSFAQEERKLGIKVGFEVGGFGEAFGGLIFVHIVVADFDGEGADAFVVGADFSH